MMPATCIPVLAGVWTLNFAVARGAGANSELHLGAIYPVLSATRPVADGRRVGTSADLRVGQSVFAIGTPLGFSRTLTAGVVSGLDRSIPSPAGTITRGAIQVRSCPAEASLSRAHHR